MVATALLRFQNYFMNRQPQRTVADEIASDWMMIQQGALN